MRRDGLLSMVALLVLSGCTTAAAGSTVVPTPTVGVTPSSVDAQRGPGGPAVVTRTVDGDTIHVTFHGQDLDVRLIGIDTPETVDPIAARAVFRRASVSLHTSAAHGPDRAVGVRRGAARPVRAHARVRLVGRTICSTGGWWPAATPSSTPTRPTFVTRMSSLRRRWWRSARTVGYGTHVPSRRRNGAIPPIPAYASPRRPRIWIARTSASAISRYSHLIRRTSTVTTTASAARRDLRLALLRSAVWLTVCHTPRSDGPFPDLRSPPS